MLYTGAKDKQKEGEKKKVEHPGSKQRLARQSRRSMIDLDAQVIAPSKRSVSA